jgi:nucleoside-diphosphate-sugar epimerase
MKKVLVTGATGFIGRHTLPILISHGYEVHAVSSQSISKDKRINWHQANLLDAKQAQGVLEAIRPTHLLHFAWYSIPGKFWTSSENLDWVCASLNLLKCFSQLGGKRVVMAGTCAEYDWSKGTCHEIETPLQSGTLYGACKASLYQIFEKFCAQSNLSGAWGRIFYLYGPYEPIEKLVSSAISHLLKNQDFPCSHGNQVRDFMHVEDVADAFVKLLDTEIRGSVNIASGQAITLKALLNTIGSHLGQENRIQFGKVKASPSEPPVLLANTTRLSTELKWKPKYSTKVGLEQTIHWWQSQFSMHY